MWNVVLCSQPRRAICSLDSFFEKLPWPASDTHNMKTVWQKCGMHIWCCSRAWVKNVFESEILCQIQKQCQEPKIEIHCRPARQALSCIAANPYKNTSHRPRLSFQACLASPFGISCVPNSTLLYPKYIAGLLGKPCARFLRNPSKNVPQILRSPDTFQVC